MQPGSYLISPGILIPRGELQHSYDLIDLGAHFLKGEPSVPLRLLRAAASAALCCHKNLYGWERHKIDFLNKNTFTFHAWIHIFFSQQL